MTLSWSDSMTSLLSILLLFKKWRGCDILLTSAFFQPLNNYEPKTAAKSSRDCKYCPLSDYSGKAISILKILDLEWKITGGMGSDKSSSFRWQRRKGQSFIWSNVSVTKTYDPMFPNCRSNHRRCSIKKSVRNPKAAGWVRRGSIWHSCDFSKNASSKDSLKHCVLWLLIF